MGVFEMAKFESGTKGVMDAVVAATKAGAVSIIGVCRINSNKFVELKAHGGILSFKQIT